MHRFVALTLVTLGLVGSLVACGGDDSGSTTSSSPTDPDGNDSKDAKKAEDSLGPSCKAYLECCKSLAKDYPQLAGQCDATTSSIDDAKKRGLDLSSVETSCKNALTTLKSSGTCK